MGSPQKSSDAAIRKEHGRALNSITNQPLPENWNMSEKKQGKQAERDRFIPIRPPSYHEDSTGLNSTSTYNSSHAGANGTAPGTRILAFAEVAPPSNSALNAGDIRLNLHGRTGAGGYTASQRVSSTGVAAVEAKKRALNKMMPERILDAPGMVDDFYTRLLAWSCLNILAVGLGDAVYVWNAGTGTVTELCQSADNAIACSLDWSDDGAFLAVAWDTGDVHIWDVENATRLRTMSGHDTRVGTLSWSSHILASGSHTGRIHMHDVRIPQHHVDSLLYHSAAITGLAWRPYDGATLASGDNDNAVVCWDWRVGSGTSTLPGAAAGTSNHGRHKEPKWAKRNHTAAVKALAWSPHQSSLLASGGGTGDHTIHFWQSTTGNRTSSLVLESQVTGIHFSHHTREILSTHGFPDHSMAIHSYPSLEPVATWNAHDARVLHSAMSPDGTVIATAAADENLKFWRIWDLPKHTSKSKEDDWAGAGTKGMR